MIFLTFIDEYLKIHSKNYEIFEKFNKQNNIYKK